MQTAPMTFEAMPPQAAAPMRHRTMQKLLAVVAMCQIGSSLFIVPIFFSDLSEIPGRGLEGWITTAVIGLSPFAAIAALIFALVGRVRFSIMAIATLSLLDWLQYASRVVPKGIVFYPSLTSLWEFVQLFVLPALCIAAIVLAARNIRLGAATCMAVTPTVLNGLGWLVFSIVVSIYGF